MSTSAHGQVVGESGAGLTAVTVVLEDASSLWATDATRSEEYPEIVLSFDSAFEPANPTPVLRLAERSSTPDDAGDIEAGWQAHT
jgi:hypothetical protein